MEGNSVKSDSFYLYIASDADEDNVYKENENTNFTIPLKVPLYFERVESYVVGLSEIFMPGAIYNIAGEMGKFKVWNKYGYKYYNVPPGLYSAPDFVEAVNGLLNRNSNLHKHNKGGEEEDTKPFTNMKLSQQDRTAADVVGDASTIRDFFAGDGTARAIIREARKLKREHEERGGDGQHHPPPPVLKRQRFEEEEPSEEPAEAPSPPAPAPAPEPEPPEDPPAAPPEAEVEETVRPTEEEETVEADTHPIPEEIREAADFWLRQRQRAEAAAAEREKEERSFLSTVRREAGLADEEQRRRAQERDDDSAVYLAAIGQDASTGGREEAGAVAGDTSAENADLAIVDVPSTKTNTAHQFKGRLSWNKNSGRIYFSLAVGEEIRFFDDVLRYMMGFAPGDRHPVNVINKKKGDKGTFTIGCRYPAQFDGAFSHCYIYCDIVKKSPTMEKEIRVLRVLPIEFREAKKSLIHRIYDQPQYQELNEKNIKDISVTIRNDLGSVIPIQRGKVLLVLHFLKKNM